MAEPEDVEEDLFADLYDADDATNQAPSAAEAQRISDPLESTSMAQQPTGVPLAQTVETDHDIDHAQGAYQHAAYEGGAPVDMNNFGQSAIHSAAHGLDDSGHQGTGIKEDG